MPGLAGPRRLAPTPAAAGGPVPIDAAMADVVDALAAAGIRAVVDAADLNAPGALLAPPAVAWTFGADQWQADWSLMLVVASTARRVALAELGALLGAATAALGYRPTTARPVEVTMPDGGTPLPGYELTWSDVIPPYPDLDD